MKTLLLYSFLSVFAFIKSEYSENGSTDGKLKKFYEVMKLKGKKNKI
jgi:hypothetical protein